MNRRRFLFSAPPAAALLHSAFSSVLRAEETHSELSLEIDLEQTIGRVPEDVMGLSYETTQLGEPDFFSTSNDILVSLFRNLSRSGNLRFGGNTSEFTYFRAAEATVAPAWSPQPTQPAQLTPITPLALRNLRGFLDATNWNCIYGLNLGTGTPQRAAEEAAAVSDILGSRLKYFQIGNEPNNYVRYLLRPETWSPQTYLSEWQVFAHAILQRVPNAKLGGPDMGAEQDWMQLFAEQAVPSLRPHLVELTDHFYAEGPPTSPSATMHNLLHNNKIDREIEVMVEAGKSATLPYRMTEVNSCYLGGKPGVSDTLGSALWAGELTLRLVVSGFSGVNFHGGSARQIKASLGGQLPGDTIAKQNATDSYYTPIAGSVATGYTARPIFYGMLLAAKLADSNLLHNSFSHQQAELTAYAAQRPRDRSLQIAIFNTGATDASILVHPGRPFGRSAVLRLKGSSLESTGDVTLGAASVDASGHWNSSEREQVDIGPDNRFRITVPPFSAVLIQLN